MKTECKIGSTKLTIIPSLRIISYHSISSLAGSQLENYGVPPDQFARQIELLLKYDFNFVDPNDLINIVTGRIPIKSESILITFDDCYSDIVEALPILVENKIKALAFPVSQLIGTDNVWDSKFGRPVLKLLNAEELRYLRSEGIALGLHGRTHTRLTQLLDSELIEEIKGSWEDLSRLGLEPLPILAYPYGVFDERVKKFAQKCGVKVGLTVHPGIVQSTKDPLQVPRIEIFPADSGTPLLDKIAHRTVVKKIQSSGFGQMPAENAKRQEISNVTLVILSCGRFDLLDLTVRSFFNTNKYPIKQVLVSEDSGDHSALDRLVRIFEPYEIDVTFCVHRHGLGIHACKDMLYSMVETEYILHLEDDWICTSARGDYIQRAKEVLAAEPSILQVWLRPPHDCNGHPLEDEILELQQARFMLLKTGYLGKWHGYSDNPNLRRKKEYLLLGSGGYSSNAKGDSGTSEAHMSQFYFSRGFRAAILVEPDAGFIHIGGARSIVTTLSATRKLWSSPKSISLLSDEIAYLRAEIQQLRARLTLRAEELHSLLIQLRALCDTDLEFYRRSVFFDGEWYLAQYPDVATARVDPLHHYLQFGAAEGRNPSSFFHSTWYLRTYPDVAAAGLNPLVHYLHSGAAEGRNPRSEDTGEISDPLVTNTNENCLRSIVRSGALDATEP